MTGPGTSPPPGRVDRRITQVGRGAYARTGARPPRDADRAQGRRPPHPLSRGRHRGAVLPDPGADARHQAVLGLLAVGFLVATIVVGVREARARARWRRLGDEP